MSENNQVETNLQGLFIIKPKTMVLGKPVYHIKELKGDGESKVLAVCPWLDDAQRIANALAQSEGGSVRMIAEDDDEARIETGENGPHIVMPAEPQEENVTEATSPTDSETGGPSEATSQEDVTPQTEVSGEIDSSIDETPVIDPEIIEEQQPPQE